MFVYGVACLQLCRISKMTTTFHRMVGLSVLLVICVSGCHCARFRGHACRNPNCRQHHKSAEVAETEVCTCTAPLYAGDQHHRQHCRKHHHLKPKQRLAAAMRRHSPEWMYGPAAGGCGDCGGDCGGCGAGGCGAGGCGAGGCVVGGCGAGIGFECASWQQGFCQQPCLACNSGGM